MNYLRIYNDIIENAKNRNLDGYKERHHILPKCMGGDNSRDNLIDLTAREHYLCHWLLAKAHNNKKLWAAFAMMCASSDKHGRITNSKIFERARKAMSVAMSGDGNPMYGKPSACKSHTQETKDKIRNSKLGKKRSPFKRKPHSEETKLKISVAKKGRAPWNKGSLAAKWLCPHCGKEGGGAANKTRWHFDNCKKNPNKAA